jgi:predicted phage tail protein
MSEGDHTFQLAQSVGSLERAVTSLEKTIDGFRIDMKEKIDEKQSKAIAQEQVVEHERRLHKKDSKPPVAPVTLWESIPIKAKVGAFTTLLAAVAALITYFTTH